MLYNVDQAIQKTEEIIEQSKRVKKGLIQNLLTEGVRDRAEFEDYRLGPIDLEKPVDWKLKKFDDFSLTVQDGPHITPDYVEEGIPFISSQNVRPFRDKFDYSQYQKFISEETYEEVNQNCRPVKGDLIISRRATIGPTQLLRHNKQFAFFVGVAVIKTDDSVYNPFLEQLMNWSVMEKLWHLKSPGSTMKTLNLGTIKEQKVPLPDLEEQKEITRILRNMDDMVIQHENEKDSLRRLKQGLMQDLLSGEARTTNGDIPVLDAVAQHG
ncbi:restriction endonuclease subunit S [Halobacterium salinarum]|uniref:restriction endonuclease subunit S n=1 Tax=Halobacterium salinarum TaxID=2242 RepID=UPI002556EAB7|nr:restriction endonuclease subunit S [Halobacterium salinarum]MDL0120281.1 restriction endonuclease subunit S [Halobacterium salinarum]